TNLTRDAGHCQARLVHSSRIDPEHSRDRHQLVVNSNQRSRQRHDKPGPWLGRGLDCSGDALELRARSTSNDDRMSRIEGSRRIGLVAPYFPPQIGGAYFYCYELAKALAGKGHEVHVFAHHGATNDSAYVLHPILTLELEPDLERLDDFDMDVWHSLFFFYAPLALRKPNVFVTGHGDDFFSL